MIRRFALTAALLALAACSGETASEDTDRETEEAQSEADGAQAGLAVAPPQTLEEAVAGAWRSEAARARDGWRNPAETIEFCGVDPAGTVVEIWPGGGWYTDIIAPWIETRGGTYVAAWPPVDPANERAAAFQSRFLERFETDLYGAATLIEFGPETGPMMNEQPADAILTFRNVHNWMAAGFAEKAFADFYAALKPGGVLCVVEHRLPSSRVQDPRAASGYVQQDYVVALAEEAGFEFGASSEINANPADTADHPFGVWTLPPVSRTSDFGAPADPDFDRAPYDAIGESDRMTLRFIKPESAEAAPGAESVIEEDGEDR
ncbi:MAG: methyltransferase [Oceanicaulis sp.]